MLTTLKNVVSQATTFILENSRYTDKEKIEEVIQKHIEYKTCLIVYDDNDEITAVCRWNISEDGIVAHILDVIVRKDQRNLKLLRRLIYKGFEMWPGVKYLSWERLRKYPYRKPKMYSLEQLIKEK